MKCFSVCPPDWFAETPVMKRVNRLAAQQRRWAHKIDGSEVLAAPSLRYALQVRCKYFGKK
jgi:hypothetical protein